MENSMQEVQTKKSEKLVPIDTSGNAVFVRAFDNIYTAIREGETIAVPLKEAKIVDI